MTRRKLHEESRRWRKIYFFLLAAVIVVGTLCAWWLAVRADRRMREDLLFRTSLLAEAVNLEYLQSLTGTEADLDSPLYLRLKEQFAAVRAATSKCRFVYLMGRRADGEVFFFVDSEPVGSEDESPAGQVYQEVSEDDLQAFDDKTALVSGPVSDRWGTWISGLVPLMDPNTGDVFAVLGMDMDARDWMRAGAVKSLPHVGLAVIALFAVFVGFFMLERRRLLEPSSSRWMPTPARQSGKTTLLNALEVHIQSSPYHART